MSEPRNLTYWLKFLPEVFLEDLMLDSLPEEWKESLTDQQIKDVEDDKLAWTDVHFVSSFRDCMEGYFCFECLAREEIYYLNAIDGIEKKIANVGQWLFDGTPEWMDVIYYSPTTGDWRGSSLFWTGRYWSLNTDVLDPQPVTLDHIQPKDSKIRRAT